MIDVKDRASAYIVLTTAAAIVSLTILVLVAVNVRAARMSGRAFNEECIEEASAFSPEADNVAAGSKVIGYRSHYNMQRHECLVDITSTRSENGAMFCMEQVFDPNDGTFIASCDRLSGGHVNNAVVLGAPFPIQKESAAQAWFNDLMRR
jgi:hypothetical protein